LNTVTRAAVVIAIAMMLAATACGTDETASTTVPDAPPCPSEPIRVVVSVDPWSDITQRLAGACAEVTTVVGSSVDPHDYEPTPGDAAAFAGADVVVLNGCGYDRWAEQAVEQSSGAPAVVNGCEVVGRNDGDNPHLWYSPDSVPTVADAITAALGQRLPAASSYLTDRRTAWDTSMQPYRDEIASISSKSAGRTYAATEAVFDDMAAALGLRSVTPEGFARAAANETDPSPADISAFDQLLEDSGADVLVFNAQTEGAIPAQVRSGADRSGVPVVEVTETPPAGATSFADWQVAQLRALATALGQQP
jgi:zinc/manganese transport system substrate-binding protein